MRRSLRFKLLATFGLVFAAMTAAAVLTVAVGGIARTDVATMDSKYVPAARLVGYLHLAAAEVNADQAAYLLAENPTALAAASARLDKHLAEVMDSLDGLAALSLTPGERSSLSAARTAWAAYLAATTSVTTVARADGIAAMQSSEVVAANEAVDVAFDSLADDLSVGARGASADAKSLLDTLPVVVVLFSALALIFGSRCLRPDSSPRDEDTERSLPPRVAVRWLRHGSGRWSGRTRFQRSDA